MPEEKRKFVLKLRRENQRGYILMREREERGANHIENSKT